MKTRDLGQGDHQVAHAQEPAAGAAEPARGRGECPTTLFTPERNNPDSCHPFIYLFGLQDLTLIPPVTRSASSGLRHRASATRCPGAS